MKRILAILILVARLDLAGQDSICFEAHVYDVAAQPLSGVRIALENSFTSGRTGSDGIVRLRFPERKVFNVIVTAEGYHTQILKVRKIISDTIRQQVTMKRFTRALDTVAVVAVHKPETLIGKPRESVHDFAFYDDRFILLMSSNSLKKARVVLSDRNGREISSAQVPPEAGEALHFYFDYEGYDELVCRDSVFRIDVWNDQLILLPVNRRDFERFIKPVKDSAHGKLYVSDQWDKYPSFSYYSAALGDSVVKLLARITNDDLMAFYNLEYYYLPSRLQLEARRIAAQYNTDEHIAAALLSGFTNSMYYEPLYAPLFIVNDTLAIFNHYRDRLYHYDREGKLVDSVPVNYHHPKNWRDWKKKMYFDPLEQKIYAFFSRDGRHYIKEIDHRTGKEKRTYKLKHHSADRIRIRDGYVYYVYRPFESTQEKFLYREMIE